MNVYMRDRATVRRAGSVSVNGMGEAVESYTDVFTGVPCSIQNSTRDLRVVEEGKVRSVSQRAYFHGTVDVRTGDRIVAGSDTFRVVGTAQKAGRVLVAYLERLP